MAKITEEIVVIKLSKLIKDTDSDSTGLASDEFYAAIQAVAEELAGPGIIVELVKE